MTKSIKGQLMVTTMKTVCEKATEADVRDPFKGKIVRASQLSFKKGRKLKPNLPVHINITCMFLNSFLSHSMKKQNSFRQG